MFKRSIKTNIISTFIFILALTSSSLIFSQYYFNYTLAVDATKRTFSLVSDNILDELVTSNKRTQRLFLPNIANTNFQKKISGDYKHPALFDLLQLMQQYPKVYATYIAQKDGSLYELINMNEAQNLYELLDAPKETRWTVVVLHNGLQTYTYLDINSVVIGTKQQRKSSDILDRVWYKEAMKSHKMVLTEPYKFHSLKDDGFTYAIQTAQKGTVLGMDLSRRNLKNFLQKQKFSNDWELFIFNKNAKILNSSLTRKGEHERFPDMHITKSIFEKIDLEKEELFFYKKGDDQYFFMQQYLFGELYLGVDVNIKSLVEPYKKSMLYSLGVSLLVLLVSIPIIFIAVSMIVKPIRALIKENEAVKKRQFQTVKKIDTNILEFLELSESQVTMAQSISAYQKSQAELLDSIVKLIAEAVDAKSPYTGGHCARVPEIAQMLVREASTSSEGVFKEFSLEGEDALREFEVGAWLHDCGKVTTPEYVVDKATKLETIYDRIHEVRTRFEVLYRDATIAFLESKIKGEDEHTAQERLKSRHQELLDDFAFIASANIGGEFMSPDKQERIKSIAKEEWIRHFDDSLGLGEVEILRYDTANKKPLPATEQLLSDKTQHIIKRENFDYESYEKHGFKEEVPEHLYNYGEVYNLCIAKGTLSPEERYKINEHMVMTIKMLEKIPFPSTMKKVPEYAGTHHETLIGTGYPRKLTKDELSIPARIMAVSDVFEALTASDRPYKKAKSLSESVKILSFMVKDEHLDRDIFELFLTSGVYMKYAKEYLDAEQIDEVDISQYISA